MFFKRRKSLRNNKEYLLDEQEFRTDVKSFFSSREARLFLEQTVCNVQLVNFLLVATANCRLVSSREV